MDKDLIPLVSVIMPVFNAEKYLKQAVDSILNQTFANFEFLIFDDGSTDNSLKILKSYNDKRINIFESKLNEGYIIHLNRGVELAKGKYIARMDADDISLPERFEKQVEFLELNKECALVGSNAIIINAENLETSISKTHIPSSLIFSNLFWGNIFFHTSIMGKTEVFKKFNYNSNYYTAEDYFLWSQIAKEFEVENLIEPLVKYRIHNESISIQKSIQQEQCVREIYKFHLSQLKINKLDDKLIELHYRLLNNKISSNKLCEENWQILKWIRILKKQNNKLLIYNASFFNSRLLIYWNSYFHFLSTFQYGIKAIPFAFDEFNKDAVIKAKVLYIFRCIKAQIKLCLK